MGTLVVRDATWDVEFGIAFEVGPRHRVVPNASILYVRIPGSSGLERSAQSCLFIV